MGSFHIIVVLLHTHCPSKKDTHTKLSFKFFQKTKIYPYS